MIAAFTFTWTKKVRHLPPFIEADDTVLVGVHILEKAVEFVRRYRESSSGESRLELVLVQVTALVAVDLLEEIP